MIPLWQIKVNIGFGLLTPVTGKAGVRMRVVVKESNCRINRLKLEVERVMNQVKTWRVLHTGFRRPLGSYGRLFSSGAGVDIFAAGPLMNKLKY